MEKRTKLSPIPNILTVLRLTGSVALLFTTLFSVGFWVIYTLCGLSDVLDGAVARVTGSVSKFGAKLDSIADLLFCAVMLLRLFPALLQKLPLAAWGLAGAVLLLRLTAYGFAAVKYRRFAALHTALNKLTGLLVFAVPYSLCFSFAGLFCCAVEAVAALAALEELAIHIRQKEYQPDIPSIFQITQQDTQ